MVSLKPPPALKPIDLLCGWIATADLWTGAVSDTDYNKRAGYLQEQEEFQRKDLVNGVPVPFTIIYDKDVAMRWSEMHHWLNKDANKKIEDFGDLLS